MRALRAHALTGPSALSVDEVADPSAPADGMVRIEVHAAGIGFVDTLVTRGLYQVRQEPPFIPGLEVAGLVEAAPAHSGLAVGDRVYASLPVGGCADTVWADEHLVAPLPDSLDFASDAAMVVNDHTAHVALVRRAGLRPGESVLVHGAAGGLGSAAVRIAAALGARVTAVASTPERRSAARAAGAEQAFGPDGWLAAVRSAGGPAAHSRICVRADPVRPGEPAAAAELRRPRRQLTGPRRPPTPPCSVPPPPIWPVYCPPGSRDPPSSSTTSPTERGPSRTWSPAVWSARPSCACAEPRPTIADLSHPHVPEPSDGADGSSRRTPREHPGAGPSRPGRLPCRR